MGYYWLVLVLVALMHHGTLKPTPLDELTINLNLNDAPTEDPTFGSPGIQSEQRKTGKTSTKDPACKRQRNQRQGQQTNEKRKRILGGKRYIPQPGFNVKFVPDYENWIASIKISPNDPRKSGPARCGGVLISPQHVLTALHCIFDTDNDKLRSRQKVKIYFDPDNLELWKSIEFEPAKFFYVKGKNKKIEYLVDTIKHPKVLKHDIALIKLNKAVDLIDLNRSSCLRSLPISKRSGIPATSIDEYWIAGWGVYKLDPYVGSQFLQYTNKLPGMACPHFETIDQSTMMCFERTNKDATCWGDSGSPGVVSINGAWHLQGIHSSGRNISPDLSENCSETRSISVDVDVYQYRDNIAQWMKQ